MKRVLEAIVRAFLISLPISIYLIYDSRKTN